MRTKGIEAGYGSLTFPLWRNPKERSRPGSLAALANTMPDSVTNVPYSTMMIASVKRKSRSISGCDADGSDCFVLRPPIKAEAKGNKWNRYSHTASTLAPKPL